jgi:hypothetical protein
MFQVSQILESVFSMSAPELRTASRAREICSTVCRVRLTRQFLGSLTPSSNSAFNHTNSLDSNTTALPLLLIQALDTSGVLKDLAMGDHDTSSVSRAKSYFLVSAIVRRNFLRPAFFFMILSITFRLRDLLGNFMGIGGSCIRMRSVYANYGFV